MSPITSNPCKQCKKEAVSRRVVTDPQRGWTMQFCSFLHLKDYCSESSQLSEIANWGIPYTRPMQDPYSVSSRTGNYSWLWLLGSKRNQHRIDCLRSHTDMQHSNSGHFTVESLVSKLKMNGMKSQLKDE
jgi:hypothetical protein